jgi:hypothetical protein
MTLGINLDHSNQLTPQLTLVSEETVAANLYEGSHVEIRRLRKQISNNSNEPN